MTEIWPEPSYKSIFSTSIFMFQAIGWRPKVVPCDYDITQLYHVRNIYAKIELYCYAQISSCQFAQPDDSDENNINQNI